ncbi:MAG: biopolymer transporter ExbD [Prevotellaceae bacterium]|jgi:biopolymer transport protein ExbD|nr:biopolymer transporter ExbD [Prevotellaceae bacterium]
MAKVKIKKKKISIDMTAMCDVAFLLLSFFIMTSTAKLPEPYPVDTPASTVQTKLPDSYLATITVGEGRIFFGVTGKRVRKRMLEQMSEKYKLEFTPEEADAFSLIDFFGVDINAMKKLIALPNAERNAKGLQPGVPYDSVNNQLHDWILCARLATKEINNEDLDIAIKGDKNLDYPMIKAVIDILQEQRKNNFFLVTNLRGEDF